MTQIKFNIAVNDSCQLSITDVTGYQPVNPTGFVLESDTTSVGWKLSEGYFTNVIQYNAYKYGKVLVNTNTDYTLTTLFPSPTYSDNFVTEKFDFTQDGVFTISRAFIMSVETYTLYKNTNRFDNLLVYYTDGVKLYKVVDEVITEAKIVDLLKETYPTTAVVTSTKIISTCFANNCYFRIMMDMLDDCDKCESNKALAVERDFLFMALESIKYMKELGNISEISKLIETIDTCGGYCKQLSLDNGCGCNG